MTHFLSSLQTMMSLKTDSLTTVEHGTVKLSTISPRLNNVSESTSQVMPTGRQEIVDDAPDGGQPRTSRDVNIEY
jgi:hypothetical protein